MCVRFTTSEFKIVILKYKKSSVQIRKKKATTETNDAIELGTKRGTISQIRKREMTTLSLLGFIGK